MQMIHTLWLVSHPRREGIYGCEEIYINSSPPGPNGRYFADDIFRCIFVNENFCILIKISLKFVPQGPNDSNKALV